MDNKSAPRRWDLASSGAMALRPIPRGSARFALAAAMASLAAAGIKGKISRFEIKEASMQPALHAGDFLLASVTRSLQRGDVVIYADPAGSGLDFVKRVIGLSGERISIAGGQIAIDGTVLGEPWADGPTMPDGEWTNPPGTVFVVGDNRRLSSGDSRVSGPVSAAGMYKAQWRYWPPASVGRL